MLTGTDESDDIIQDFCQNLQFDQAMILANGSPDSTTKTRQFTYIGWKRATWLLSQGKIEGAKLLGRQATVKSIEHDITVIRDLIKEDQTAFLVMYFRTFLRKHNMMQLYKDAQKNSNLKSFNKPYDSKSIDLFEKLKYYLDYYLILILRQLHLFNQRAQMDQFESTKSDANPTLPK